MLITVPRDGTPELHVPVVPYPVRSLEEDQPFPDVLPLESSWLARWLDSIAVYPDPRSHKCNFWQSPPGTALRLKKASDSRFIWLRQGTGWAWVGDERRKFRLEAGDGMLVPPWVEHDFVGDGVQPLVYFGMHFTVETVGGFNPLAVLGFPHHLPAGPDAPYGAAAGRMAREFAERAPGWRLAIAAAMQEVLLYLVRYRGSAFTPLPRTTAGRNLLKLQPAMQLIEERLDDPGLNVGDLADRVAVSEVYLRRLFREVTGISPTAYVQRRRVERACLLLQEAERLLPEIATRCGFASVPYFHRIFKRWIRMTPAQYRRGLYGEGGDE